MRVLTGLALWGLAEIAAFVLIGAWIGVAGVLALVVGTGLLGVIVLRRQGVQALRHGLRTETLGSNGLMLAAGLLLVLPGLISDLAGALLLVPALRRWLTKRLAAKFRAAPADDVLEGVAVEVAAPRLRSGPPSGWTRP